MERITLVSKNDLLIEWFSGSGPGGQYRNKHQNCCRMTHKPSGVTVTATRERSQEQNKKEAFIALTKNVDFKLWLARKLTEIRLGSTVEERVERQMHPRNLKIECIQNGQWVDAETVSEFKIESAL